MGYRLNRFDSGEILTSDCTYCSLDKRLPNGLRSDLTQSYYLLYTPNLMRIQVAFKAVLALSENVRFLQSRDVRYLSKKLYLHGCKRGSAALTTTR